MKNPSAPGALHKYDNRHIYDHKKVCQLAASRRGKI